MRPPRAIIDAVEVESPPHPALSPTAWGRGLKNRCVHARERWKKGFHSINSKPSMRRRLVRGLIRRLDRRARHHALVPVLGARMRLEQFRTRHREGLDV